MTHMNIKDIAKLANTSVSTVSRSLNDSDLVADITKKKILAIAKETGFEFNASARGLVTRNIGTIGIILPDHYDKFSTNLYHSTLHNDLRKSLERADKDLIVAFCRNRFSGKSNIQKLVCEGNNAFRKAGRGGRKLRLKAIPADFRLRQLTGQTIPDPGIWRRNHCLGKLSALRRSHI